jgi:hypothetical protein
VSGQPLEASARGRSVRVGWGNGPLADAEHFTEPPARSLLAAVEPFLTSRDGKPVQRLAVVWPGRLSWVAKTPPSFRLASESLEASPPMVWTGWERDGHTFDRVEWRSLRSTVHRVLETVLPQPAPGQPSSLVPRESH